MPEPGTPAGTTTRSELSNLPAHDPTARGPSDTSKIRPAIFIPTWHLTSSYRPKRGPISPDDPQAVPSLRVHHVITLPPFSPVPCRGGALFGIAPFRRFWAIQESNNTGPTEPVAKPVFITLSELRPCHYGNYQRSAVPPCRVRCQSCDPYLKTDRDIHTICRRRLMRRRNRYAFRAHGCRFAVDPHRHMPGRYRDACPMPKALK
jgi:hypothetical protein